MTIPLDLLDLDDPLDLTLPDELTPDGYHRIMVTRAALTRWTTASDRPLAEPLAIIFGHATALHFVDMDPADFELYPIPYMPDGTARFTRAGEARFRYADAFPTAIEIFDATRKK